MPRHRSPLRIALIVACFTPPVVSNDISRNFQSQNMVIFGRKSWCRDCKRSLSEEATSDSSSRRTQQSSGIAMIAEFMDRSQLPCQDWNAYSCGGFRRDNPWYSVQNRASVFDEVQSRVRRQEGEVLFSFICMNPSYGSTWVARHSYLWPDVAAVACLRLNLTHSPVTDLNAAIGGFVPKCLDTDNLERESIPRAVVTLRSLMPGCLIDRTSGDSCTVSKIELSQAIVGAKRIFGASVGFFDFQVGSDPRDTSKSIFYISGQGSIPQVLAMMPGVRPLLETTLVRYLEEAVRLGFPRHLNVKRMLDFYELLGSTYYTSAVEVPEDDIRFLTAATLQAEYPAVSWTTLVETLFPGNSEVLTDIGLQFPTQLGHMNDELSKLSADDLADIISIEVLMALDKYLPRTMREIVAEFDRQFQGYALDRASHCILETMEFGSWAIARNYIANHFTEEGRLVVHTLAEDSVAAFVSMAEKLEWMSQDTREKAIEKAHAMLLQVGYPDWLPTDDAKLLNMYTLANGTRISDLNLHVSSLELMETVNQMIYDAEIKKLVRPTTREDWLEPPTRVSPYYNQMMNKIVFPAAFLQPPIFDPSLPPAYFYGTVGWVMAHEVTHGFDWTGSMRDGNGTLTGRWFSSSSAIEYEKRTQCFIEMYSGLQARAADGSSYPVDGAITLSENIADSGGVALAYMAYKRRHAEDIEKPSPIPGLSNLQLFFLGLGQALTNCAVESADFLKNEVQTSQHAPGSIRGTMSFRNLPEFSKTFSCPASSPMNPAHRCVIWEVYESSTAASSPDMKGTSKKRSTARKAKSTSKAPATARKAKSTSKTPSTSRKARTSRKSKDIKKKKRNTKTTNRKNKVRTSKSRRKRKG